MGKSAMRLCVMRCSSHGVFAVSIDDESGGFRVTPSKCCGSWTDVARWHLSEREWLDIATEAKRAAKLAKAAP